MRAMKTPVVVRSGDCVASIAARHGRGVDEVWEDPENAELRDARGTPFILSPGDIVRVQARPPARCPVQEGGSNRYRAEVPRVHVRIRLVGPPQESRGAPSALSDVPYALVAGALRREGRTGSDGAVDEVLPAYVRAAELVVWPGEARETRSALQIGALNPKEEASGVRQRLENLGFSRLLPREEQIRAFQSYMGLPASGALDGATREKLDELHRS
jgi:hypothetical protein